jgi:anti-sigma factor RsiW
MSDSFYQRHVEREILSALLDGELDADERRFVYEHLRECEACREASEEFDAIKGLVEELPRLVAPSSFVNRALEPKSRASARSLAQVFVRGRRKWIFVCAAAGATVITIAGLFVPESASKPPVDAFVARHVSVHDGTNAGGQVLFAVNGR